MGETEQMAQQAGSRQPYLEPGPLKARDNPADGYELSGALDVRCRACGQIVARGSRGDSLGSVQEAAGEHKCPMLLAPGDWLDVVQQGYEAYRAAADGESFAKAVPWAVTPPSVQNAWRDAAVAIVKAYLRARARPRGRTAGSCR